MGVSEGGNAVGIRGKNEEKFFVSVRLRPLNHKEVARNDASDWECINDNTIIYKDDNVFMPGQSVHPTAYRFDKVFGSNCSTRQVYKEGVREVALSVVNGINSTIFAYGQTSSGKTYTMTGITEYTIADIYDHIRKHTEREYLLKFSAMEIYNESVRDLLSTNSTPLRLLDDPQRGTIVEKLTEATVRDWNHVGELLSVCEAQRQIGETSLNETSSRSHQIIRLTIESSARDLVSKDNSSTLIAAVNFVDLAGSEHASQSYSAGTRLKEGSHINRSLLTLGTVIHKLSNRRHDHVPYRDSKLTRILQSSLGGNARTAIICTLSPARSHVEQSKNTLSFASCAKEVSTDAHVNVIISDKALVNHLQRELARMETELSSPRSTFSESRFSAILREKDLKIEKLEKEVQYLKTHLDAAESEVHNLLQQMGDEGRTPSRVGYSPYPHLRIHQSPNDEQPLQDIGRTFCRYQPSDVYSSSSFNTSYVELPGVNEYLQNDTPSRILISASQFSEGESTPDMEESDVKSDGTFEDVFKEFMDKYLDVDYLSSEHNTKISPRMPFQEVENEHQNEVSVASQEDGGVVYPPIRQGRRSFSPLLKVNKQVLKSNGNESSEFASAWTTESSKLSNPLFVNASPELPSSQHEEMKNRALSGRLNLKRGTTFKPGLSVSLSSPWLEDENDENKPPKGSTNSDKHVDDSNSSAGNVPETELEVRHQGTSNHSNISSNTCIVDTEFGSKLQHDDSASDNVVNETEATSTEPMKSVKDVNKDPIKECLRRRANWPLEFKRLQREIIKLWDACNVSLVHRSHFFLLFKGDPNDCIYMEVELRRLLFLKDTFTHGNETVKDGHVLTLASSAKALLRERQMLAAQMQKQLSGVERETLFLEWGVPLDGKYRRLQLINLLWSDTEDMDHIERSANVISKLVDHPTHKNFKEMFSFNFAHWG